MPGEAYQHLSLHKRADCLVYAMLVDENPGAHIKPHYINGLLAAHVRCTAWELRSARASVHYVTQSASWRRSL